MRAGVPKTRNYVLSLALACGLAAQTPDAPSTLPLSLKKSIEIALAPGRMRRHVAIVCDAAGLEPVRLLNWILAYAGLGAA